MKREIEEAGEGLDAVRFTLVGQAPGFGRMSGGLRAGSYRRGLGSAV